MIKKIIKMTLAIIISIAVPLTAATALFFYFAPQIGGSPEGQRMERMKNSPNYAEGKFVNPVLTSMDMSLPDLTKTLWQVMKGDNSRQPGGKIETRLFEKEAFLLSGDTEIAISWFGHSSVLIKMEGKVILADPVFSERASMFSFMGPKRYDYSHHMTVNELPDIDYVIISHDHYDHLDYETITELKDKVGHFYIPLGVGAHLESWGVDSALITEMDWWQEVRVGEELTLAFTPTRHFSGRGLTNRFSTLWGSWVIMGKNQRMFFGGDSGYFPGFKEIGEKYGPFDITMLECGQYNERWANIHMMPEQTLQAHLDLKGEILMPIHWGKFTLSLHPWKEPVERVSRAANEHGVKVITPVAGDQIKVYTRLTDEQWWASYN